MFTCFKCSKSFKSTKYLILHFRVVHNLANDSIYHCAQENCSRIFSSLNSFRKHLLIHDDCQSLDLHTYVVNTSLPPEQGLVEIHFESNKVAPESIDFRNYTSPFDRVNLDSLKETLNQDILQFISKQYSNSLLPRNVVQSFLLDFQNIYLNKAIPTVKDIVLRQLQSQEPMTNIVYTIDACFKVLENSLNPFSTEYKRLELLKSAGGYIPPKEYIVGNRIASKSINNNIIVENIPITACYMPLREILTELVNKPHVFETMKTHYDELYFTSDNTIICNFIQGALWKSRIKKYGAKRVFPLFLYFDDFEVGNALGSHAGKNKLGAVYISIASLPSFMLSTLSNMYLCCLFNSFDRKEFGNKAVFWPLIQELKYLESAGIEVIEHGRSEHIYFKLGLILGDNLGLNSILGFTESFSSNYCCRLCKVHKSELHSMALEREEILRNEVTYSEDVSLNDVSLSGIKESCVWHNLEGFHVTNNYCADMMHDILEGVCVYDMTLILNILIFEMELFTLDLLNLKMKYFSYSALEVNKPPPITRDHLKTKLRMSASEMLCFTRFFGLYIGSFVPQNLDIWNLWILLREILDVTMSPALLSTEYIRLQDLVQQHNMLYLKYAKTLKPKFHNLVHYPIIFQQSGPFVHFSAMRFEQKHHESKYTSNVSGSFKNIILTLARKAQLKLSYQLCGFSHTSIIVRGPSYNHKDLDGFYKSTDFEYVGSLFFFRWIDFKGTRFKKNIIIIKSCADIPVFAKVVDIFEVNLNIFFLCEEFDTIGFDRHTHSYTVQYSSKTTVIPINESFHNCPCILTKSALSNICSICTYYAL